MPALAKPSNKKMEERSNSEICSTRMHLFDEIPSNFRRVREQHPLGRRKPTCTLLSTACMSRGTKQSWPRDARVRWVITFPPLYYLPYAPAGRRSAVSHPDCQASKTSLSLFFSQPRIKSTPCHLHVVRASGRPGGRSQIQGKEKKNPTRTHSSFRKCLIVA